jgi:hypothetical protein
VDDGASSRKEEQHLFLFFSFFTNERIHSHIGPFFFLLFFCMHTYICLIVFLAGST